MIHALVQKKRLRLTPSHKRIVNFIERNYDQALFMTSLNLASHAQVSEATVIRFAQLLGFDGYPGMQKYLRGGLQDRLSTVTRLQKSISVGTNDILTKTVRQDIINLSKSLEDIRPNEFQKAVDSIHSARCVYFIGMRGAHAPAMIFGVYLRFLNRNVVLITPGYGDVWNNIYPIGPEDLAVAISLPRYYRLTVELLEYAKKKGANTGAITDSMLSPLAPYANWILPIHCYLDSYMESYTAAVCIANALITAVSMKDPAETRRVLEEHENLWEEKRDFVNLESKDIRKIKEKLGIK